MPAYPLVLRLLKNRPDAVFLDIGCCSKRLSYLGVCPDDLTHVFALVSVVGAEVRKVIYDGWPITQTIATDLEAGTALCLLLHCRRVE